MYATKLFISGFSQSKHISNFATLKTTDVKRVERILNHLPRKRLDYLTPREVFVLGRLHGAVHDRIDLSLNKF